VFEQVHGMEDNKQNLSAINEAYHEELVDSDGKIVVPVIEEQVVISKEIVETGKVLIKKRVKEEEAFINIPLIQEGYQVECRPGKKELLTHHPSIRHEGDKMIIPVVREVLVVEKRYEVTEEVHVIKTKTEVPNMQQITLLKEEVQIERKSTNQ
jgi:uncharacterized protein (TIGR02271 family)